MLMADLRLHSCILQEYSSSACYDPPACMAQQHVSSRVSPCLMAEMRLQSPLGTSLIRHVPGLVCIAWEKATNEEGRSLEAKSGSDFKQPLDEM